VSDVLVLCYHAVSPAWVADLSVTPDALERQIGHLLRRGWRPATFTEAVLNPTGTRTLAITFDDAFASVRAHALPILTALGARATVFAPTAFMDGPEPLRWPGIDHWRDTDSAPELAAMSWADLGELSERGWEIASHTRTHPHLTELDDDERLTIELGQSRDDVERRIGRPCLAIAYPYGDVDGRVEDRARALGYLAGASLSSALTRLGPHRHPRVGIYHADSWWRFRLKATRPLRVLRGSALWSLRP
jgi:peptidoglycan/xylan/chitin deacetylase (PgdA/CDA1 family)